MTFSCFTQKLKEKVGRLFVGVGGGGGYICDFFLFHTEIEGKGG